MHRICSTRPDLGTRMRQRTLKDSLIWFLCRIFKLVVTILMCCHYSCNFFLYCAFNRKFIRELHRLWNTKVKPTFLSQPELSTSTHNSNEAFNKVIALSWTPKKTSVNRKRRVASVTQVSLKIGLSKKTYRETSATTADEGGGISPSGGDLHFNAPTSSF